jgi:hypothetical protein
MDFEGGGRGLFQGTMPASAWADKGKQVLNSSQIVIILVRSPEFDP